MSSNFHVNQYEQAFDPKRTQNWECPKAHQGDYPKRREGFSTIHANSRGHLLPGVPRSRESPWGTFVGNWDMPTKIPGNRQLNATARCEDAQLKLIDNKLDASEVMGGGLKKCKIPSPLPVKADVAAEPANNGPFIHPPTPKANGVACKTLAAPVFPMNHHVNIPAAPGGNRDDPVGNPMSPKPPTPMNLGGDGVQMNAAARISPVNPEAVAVKGAVATPPVELHTHQMRTPEVDVNWPIARSAEPDC